LAKHWRKLTKRFQKNWLSWLVVMFYRYFLMTCAPIGPIIDGQLMVAIELFSPEADPEQLVSMPKCPLKLLRVQSGTEYPQA